MKSWVLNRENRKTLTDAVFNKVKFLNISWAITTKAKAIFLFIKYHLLLKGFIKAIY